MSGGTDPRNSPNLVGAGLWGQNQPGQMPPGGQAGATPYTGTPTPSDRPLRQSLQDFGFTYLDRANMIAQRPYEQSPTQVAGTNPYQTGAWNAIANRAMQGSPVMGAANQTLQNTVSGNFLQGNPYLDSQIQRAQGDLNRTFQTQILPNLDFRRMQSGSYGNSGLNETERMATQDFLRASGDLAANMRFQNYGMERGLQQQALGMAPQFAQQDYNDANMLLQAGNQIQQQDQAQAGQNYRWWQEAQQFPQQQNQQFGNAIAQIAGTTPIQQQQQPGTSPAAAAFGGMLTGSQLGQSLGIGSPWGAALGGLLGLYGR